MTECYVSLKSIQDVREFVSAASLSRADIDAISGRYTVDAKSIMGLFSLELSKPLLLRLYGDEAESEKFMASIAHLLAQKPEEI